MSKFNKKVIEKFLKDYPDQYNQILKEIKVEESRKANRKTKKPRTQLQQQADLKRSETMKKKYAPVLPPNAKELKDLASRKTTRIQSIINSFGNVATVYQISPTATTNLIKAFWKDVDPATISVLKTEFKKLGGIKTTIIVSVKFERTFTLTDKNGKVHHMKETTIASFHSSKYVNALAINNLGDIYPVLNKMKRSIEKQLDEFCEMGSNWAVYEVLNEYVNIIKYDVLKAGSYIKTPAIILKKNATVNIKNEDNKCFLWASLAHIHPVKKNANMVSHYKKFVNDLNMAGINYPVKYTDIDKIEDLNEKYGWCIFQLTETNKVRPLRPCTKRGREIITLLLLTGEGENNHYILVKDNSRLLSSQLSKHNQKTFICQNCLCHFTTEECLENHKKLNCEQNKPAQIILPTPDKAFVEFKNYKHQLRAPFVIYCDTEALTVPVKEDNDYQKHEGCSYGYKVISTYKEHETPYQSFRGENAIYELIQELLIVAKNISTVIYKEEPIIWGPEDKITYKKATHCHICKGELDGDKVADHDHINGKYRGPAHNNCNLNYNLNNYKIPVIFHNLRGYDSHLIIEQLGRITTIDNIDCIANTPEKYISFTVNSLKFIDSYQHLHSSLDGLIKTYSKKGNFEILKNDCPEFTEKQIKLLTQKGIYPYDYMNGWEKFEEQNLPSKDDFFSALYNENISDEEYKHALEVWKLFNCKTLGDYHDLYLKTDVLLLAEVFESYRDICLQYYGIDPAYYLTAPSLSWDAMMKMTGQKIHTFNNEQIDMLLFIENSIRGGVCMISKRFSQANNKYMPNFDNKKQNKYLLYLDANNLYGWAMSQLLPNGDFSWGEPSKYTEKNIMSLRDDGEYGAILQVDLEYPESLHDLHNDYPLAPENIAGEYSEYLELQMKNLGVKIDETEKLIPNLKDKTEYILHYRNLKYYLSHGLKLKKVHRVLTFKQSAWLKPYIDFNSSKRAEKGISDFQKDFFKLMNNAIYGKTCENVRKRIDVKLFNDNGKCNKYISRPNFKDTRIFNNNLMAVQMAKTTVNFDKPIYAGSAILDLSKLLMYEFHYDVMKNKYGEKCQLLMTDTDSLVYEIETEDVYQDMKSFQEKFDTASYPKDHLLFDEKNNKVPGKFKDELSGAIMTEFIGLRPKSYSYLVQDDNHGHIKSKGIKESAKKTLTHDDHRRALFGVHAIDLIQHTTFNQIKSRKHVIVSTKVSKISLSGFDSKRLVSEDRIHTYALGHYKIL